VIHYHPREGISSPVVRDQIYLLDSGGQYYDGTTDVTRTMHFGNPTQEEKNAYTRVLLGNLDVERLQYPANANIHGGDIDILARRWLWANGLDYGHGTGHGVGYFLNVHEGPNGISKYRTTPLVPGMVVSNEPGYYKDGSFGIRVENLLLGV
jgi:Xaa-Pro aminopeptidase